MIRPATPVDAPLLARLHAASFTRPWVETEMAALLSQTSTLGLLDEQDGEITGFLLLRLATDEAEILTLAVSPDHRRQGIARRLLEQSQPTLKAASINTLFLEVSEENHPAQRLYRHCGFAINGRRKGYYLHADKTRSDAILMRLPL